VTNVDPVHAPAPVAVRGRPTDAELAALIGALLAALAPGAAEAAPVPAHSRWTDRARGWHALPRSGPSSWRASALPR
jgi:acyl-CoA carboxylase epsilon subunit